MLNEPLNPSEVKTKFYCGTKNQKLKIKPDQKKKQNKIKQKILFVLKTYIIISEIFEFICNNGKNIRNIYQSGHSLLKSYFSVFLQTEFHSSQF